MSKKPVIVFEGIEGSGKTFHINQAARFLKKKKIDFIKLREPGGSLNSEKIRKLILNKDSNFNQNTDLLLYLAARSENIDLLKKYYHKKVILLDRFIDSTFAYQHYGFGINSNLINLINSYLLMNFKINFTFLNTVNKKNMLQRLKSRKKLNRYDQFNASFYQRVQIGFLKLAKKKRNRYLIIDSNLDKNKNIALIEKKLESLL